MTDQENQKSGEQSHVEEIDGTSDCDYPASAERRELSPQEVLDRLSLTERLTLIS